MIFSSSLSVRLTRLIENGKRSHIHTVVITIVVALFGILALFVVVIVNYVVVAVITVSGAVIAIVVIAALAGKLEQCTSGYARQV